MGRGAARLATAADLERVERAAAAASYLPRAALAAAGPAVPAALAVADVAASIVVGTATIADAADATAIATRRPDDWATERLGVAVHRVAAWSAGSEAGRATASRAALEQVVGQVRAAGGGLVVVPVDAADRVVGAAARQVGLEVVDAEHTYVSDACRAVAGPRGPSPAVTVHDRDDLPRFTGAVRAAFGDRAAAAARSHLTADRRLDPARVALFYRDWTEHVLDGSWGDRLAVAWDGGRPIGFFSWVFDHDAPVDGGLLHRSWALVTDPGRGALAAMTRAIVGGAAGARWTECETRTANQAMNRALLGTGASPTVRATLVLHGWIAGVESAR